MQIGKKTLLLFIMLIELSSSCSTKIPTESVSSFSSSPFSTAQPGTSSPIITNSSATQINFSCWLIKALEEGNEIKGSFFYTHKPVPQNPLNENDYFIWDISSFHSKEHALNKRFRDITISFSGDRVTALGDDLFFISNNGVQSYSLSDEPFAKDKFYYINYEQPKRDGKIFIREYGQIDNYTEGLGFTDTFYIFDPVSRKISEQQLFFPNLYKMANRNPFAIYSPSMKYALYESTPKDGNHRQYTLYDIENEKVLMVIPPQDSNLEVIDDDPQWLSNTDIVTAEFYDRKTKKYNQYSISLDGTISPITNLPADVGVSTRFLGSQYWSPNNRYFALADFNLHLYIWDNRTDTLYKPCLPNENNVMSAPQLTWSFDGNYVVVTLVFPSLATPIVDPSGQIIEQRIVSKYILDFSNKTIYTLPNDVNEREYPQNFTNGYYQYIGWVNWEIP